LSHLVVVMSGLSNYKSVASVSSYIESLGKTYIVDFSWDSETAALRVKAKVCGGKIGDRFAKAVLDRLEMDYPQADSLVDVEI